MYKHSQTQVKRDEGGNLRSNPMIINRSLYQFFNKRLVPKSVVEELRHSLK